MRPVTVTLDPNDFKQFPPQVQEALWRLARQVRPEDDRRPASERMNAKLDETEQQYQARRSKHVNQDGSVIMDSTIKPAR
jgi:hypothetical protein